MTTGVETGAGSMEDAGTIDRPRRLPRRFVELALLAARHQEHELLVERLDGILRMGGGEEVLYEDVDNYLRECLGAERLARAAGMTTAIVKLHRSVGLLEAVRACALGPGSSEAEASRSKLPTPEEMACEALASRDVEPPPEAGYWFAEGVAAERTRAFLDAMRAAPSTPELDALRASARRARALATGEALAQPEGAGPGERVYMLMEAMLKVVGDGDDGLPAALLAEVKARRSEHRRPGRRRAPAQRGEDDERVPGLVGVDGRVRLPAYVGANAGDVVRFVRDGDGFRLVVGPEPSEGEERVS